MSDQPQPPTHVSPPGFVEPSTGLAVAALICGIVGMVFCMPVGIAGLVMGIIAVKRANREPQKYGGKGLAIGGIVTGAISPFIIFPLLMAILIPSLARPRELSKRTVCQMNMQGIVQALHVYEKDHGAYPPGLDTLIANGSIVQSQLVCPSAETANYEYVVPSHELPRTTAVLLYEPIENHQGEGGNFCRLDGSVSFERESTYNEIVPGVVKPSQ